MRIAAILNKDAGPLETWGLDRFSGVLSAAFSGAGHKIKSQFIPSSALLDILEAAENDTEVDVVLAGGRDGIGICTTEVCLPFSR